MKSKSQPYSILLAEDDPISRRLFEKILTKEGFSVTTAENGRKALDLTRRHFFPLVLTDWQMPEVEGPDLCRMIRKENSESYVYIIMLTSKGSKDDIISGLKAGADDFLTKPAHHEELLARINTGIRILELEKSLKNAVDKIHIMSITDPLTEVYNRSFINERLPQEIGRAIRYDRDLSIMICDIDHFKKVNDTHGHLTGDTVLKKFAQCLSNNIRQHVDWVGRFGGEEFLLVLPETNLSGAMVLAERIRKVVAECEMAYKGISLFITASFGVTSFSSVDKNHTVTPEMLLGAADILLYEAKEGGRNDIRGRQWTPQ